MRYNVCFRSGTDAATDQEFETLLSYLNTFEAESENHGEYEEMTITTQSTVHCGPTFLSTKHDSRNSLAVE